MKRKHGLLLFITSCVPGCGQMHQGYMKRGLSLILAACFLIVLSILLRLDFLMVFLIPLWLFSFFDSYNLRGQTDEQAAANPDSFLFGLSEMDSEKLSTLFRKRSSIIGWGLVALGAYILFDTFVGRLMWMLCESLDNWRLYDIVMRDFPRLIVTIGIIALGVWFIRGPKLPKNEEIPVFTPPAAGPNGTAEPENDTAAEPESSAEAAEQEADHGAS